VVEHVQRELMPFFIYDHMLFTVQLQATRQAAGQIGLILQLVIEHILYTVAVPITFILRDGKPDVDVKPPVRGGGVIGFRHGLPLHMIRFKDFLNLVIVCDIPKPAVELRENNQVEVMALYTVQQPDKFLPLRVFLPGGQGFIDERVHKDKMILQDKVVKDFILRVKGVAVKHLVFMAASDILSDTHPV